jgi:hypothetical protein
MKKILRKPFRIIGNIDAGCSYTTAEASRLVTASMGVLQSLALSGELAATKSGPVWMIRGADLLDFAKQDAKARKERKEKTRERKIERLQKSRQNQKQSKQQEQLPLTAKKDDVKPFVLIRARDAGVHCGTLEQVDRDVVKLSNARRVWRWKGANTLHELSLRGADTDYTRISEPVAHVVIIGACEIIDCTQAARENLIVSRWGA